MAVAWFPYSEGWLSGHGVASANGGPITTLYANPLVRLGADKEFIEHYVPAAGGNPAANGGLFTVNLTALDSHGLPATSANGVLLAIGGKNEDNYAMARDNADGTFSLTVKDNGTDGTGAEQDGVAFAYVPVAAVNTGHVKAVGRIQSDGSAVLTWRSPADFRVVRTQVVRREGRAVPYLNELEWAEGALYANVWMSDEILRIDPADGRVTAVWDAGGLLSPAEKERAEVLNGIAWEPGRRIFHLTGKYWPSRFEVELPEPTVR